MNVAAQPKSFSRKRRSRKTNNRPWIPPPAKTTNSFLAHPETNTKNTLKNKSELDTLQDIQSKITELDHFVKSLDSVLGRIRSENEKHAMKYETHDIENETHDIIDKTGKGAEIIPVKDHDTFIDDKVVEKLSDYKKKIKLLLKVVEISELEREKLRQLVEDRELVVISLAKDLDNWKTKFTESYAEKKETETKLEKILMKLNVIETQQLKRNSMSPNSKTNVQLDTLTDENVKLKAKVFAIEKHLNRSEQENKKLKETILINTEKNFKKDKIKDSNKKGIEMDKLQITVETLGKHNESFQNALRIMEKQLEDANLSISKLSYELCKTSNQSGTTNKGHLDQNRHQWKDTNIAHCTDLQVLREELQAKSVRIFLLEDELRQKSEEIAKFNKEKTRLEYEYEVKLKDCERQLHISLTTNQSLQNYVTHLKNSYAAVFSQPI